MFTQPFHGSPTKTILW